MTPESRRHRRCEDVQVRGILPERVVLSAPLDPYLPLTALANYAGVSVRTLRAYLEQSRDPLPCFRLPGGAHGPGKILVRRSDWDRWVERFRSKGRPSLVAALRELGLTPPP